MDCDFTADNVRQNIGSNSHRDPERHRFLNFGALVLEHNNLRLTNFAVLPLLLLIFYFYYSNTTVSLPTMDFASLMSKAIDKSKSSSSSSKQDPESVVTTRRDSRAKTESKKYLKRSELEAEREAKYLADEAAREAERQAKVERKRKAEEEEAEEKRRRDERRQKLAEESRRAREEEEAEKERERRRRLGLPEKVAETETEKDGDDGGKAKHEKSVIKSNGPIPTTFEAVPEVDMKVSRAVPPSSDEAGREMLFRQLTSYFNLVLSEWQIALANRDESVKTSFQGKAAARAMVQAKDDLRPLFKKLETDELDSSVLESVVEIVAEAQGRRYVSANDVYLRLSIGKA